MKRILGLAVLLAFVATTASAGGKCKQTTQECLDYMATKMKDGGWVGVELDYVEGDSGPMKVTKVVPGSPAEGAGIEPGDLLVAMNGIALAEENRDKIMEDRKTWMPGSSVTWTMKRNEADREVAITLAPMPADVLAAYIGQHMLEHASVELAATQ